MAGHFQGHRIDRAGGRWKNRAHGRCGRQGWCIWQAPSRGSSIYRSSFRNQDKYPDADGAMSRGAWRSSHAKHADRINRHIRVADDGAGETHGASRAGRTTVAAVRGFLGAYGVLPPRIHRGAADPCRFSGRMGSCRPAARPPRRDSCLVAYAALPPARRFSRCKGFFHLICATRPRSRRPLGAGGGRTRTLSVGSVHEPFVADEFIRANLCGQPPAIVGTAGAPCVPAQRAALAFCLALRISPVPHPPLRNPGTARAHPPNKPASA